MLFFEKRKVVTKVIIITLYITFVCTVLGQNESITRWNYRIHEMLYIPINIAMFLVPFLIIIWSYYAIRSILEKREFNTKNNIKDYARNLILFTSVILIFTYFNILFTSITVGGIFEVENKIIEEERYYYLILDDVKVKCRENEFNLIKKGESYLIDYKSNSKWPHKGKLERIDLLDFDPN